MRLVDYENFNFFFGSIIFKESIFHAEISIVGILLAFINYNS